MTTTVGARIVQGPTVEPADSRPVDGQQGLSVASLWRGVAASPLDDSLLEWAPDVFALTHVLLEHSEAHRFAWSPPGGSSWPPGRFAGWADAVTEVARRWCGWIEDRQGSAPRLLLEEWGVLIRHAHCQLNLLTKADDWQLCEAVLTLHAIADEACAGLGVALTASHGTGSLYRARGRELLARTGSLSRIPPHLLRVLPKVRTSPTGTSSRSLSRYACVTRPDVQARWNKLLGRRPGTGPQALGSNFLLLPWPLRVRGSDFRCIEGSVQNLEREPTGFFEFVPGEALDLDLVDRMLIAAKDEVGTVDVVCLPESAVAAEDIDDLEAVLVHHGVRALIAGVRQRPQEDGRLAANWVHLGARAGNHWVHIRQNKHHRWSLDQSQIYQYHLGSTLHPHILWWEAIDVPRRKVEFVEVADGITLVSLVCEDLAQIDNLAEVLRSVGPTMVVTPLLDGPQLSSRWAARYASVLADDPGSAVLTLTSYGMAQRSRPHKTEASPVIALWKDPLRGTREIPLEPGAQGVILMASADLTTRRSADGRRPVDNCTEFFDVGVCQIRASRQGSGLPSARPATPPPPVLGSEELTVLYSWAEAIAEALVYAPRGVGAVLDSSRRGAGWRAGLGLAELTPRLSRAIDALDQVVRPAATGDDPSLNDLLAAVMQDRPGQTELDALVHSVLRSALEQRRTRHMKETALRLGLLAAAGMSPSQPQARG
ncbi:MAG TPA: hypothetical protein VHZ02_03780 [Acidimicrobiales bacterium]|nr:hypothetical protein [Acidimicrobiales bacterium]